MKGVVEEIFVTGEGSAAMERVGEVRTIKGCGIEGDRYCAGTGFWTRYGDVCEVTLIEGVGRGSALGRPCWSTTGHVRHAGMYRI